MGDVYQLADFQRFSSMSSTILMTFDTSLIQFHSKSIHSKAQIFAQHRFDIVIVSFVQFNDKKTRICCLSATLMYEHFIHENMENRKRLPLPAALHGYSFCWYTAQPKHIIHRRLPFLVVLIATMENGYSATTTTTTTTITDTVIIQNSSNNQAPNTQYGATNTAIITGYHWYDSA